METDHKSDRLYPVISATAFAQSNTQLNRDPTTVKFVTSDIGNFWRPYDLAAKETEKSKRIQIYQTEYFDKASPGLKDFLTLRIKSAQNLVAVIDPMPKYYVHVQGHLNQIGISTLCI